MKRYALLLLCFVTHSYIHAQDPNRFKEEIQLLNETYTGNIQQSTVFTGSSSVRLWKDLETDCQNLQPINTGFGGSQMADLLYYLDDLVLRFKPETVYIYEGDNDINDGKSPETVLETAKKVTDKILDFDKSITIYFISAKPSPSRWNYKDAYVKFNALLKTYCESHPNLRFIDVWHPMLNENGRPLPNIFIEDSLHMNRKGYDIWKDLICKTKN